MRITKTINNNKSIQPFLVCMYGREVLYSNHELSHVTSLAFVFFWYYNIHINVILANTCFHKGLQTHLATTQTAHFSTNLSV